MLHLGKRIKWRIHRGWQILAFSCILSGLVITASATGLMQPFEWAALDRFFQIQPSQDRDPHILIVTIGEEDISYLGQWPITDQTLARLLKEIYVYHPRAIGLDIYRNLPVGVGHHDLAVIFKEIPILIGIEKAIGEQVPPPPELAPEQVSISDLVVDADGRVRRGLLAIVTEDGQQKYGLATRLALTYLAQEQIYPQIVHDHLILGKAVFKRFKQNDGSYVNADAGGSQVLINFPAGNTYFETVSLSDVLSGHLSTAQVENRIVLIGSTAISLNDFFSTPIAEMPGVFVHAHIVSQLLGSALDGRVVLQGSSQWSEYLWVILWTNLAAQLIYTTTQTGHVYRQKNILTLIWILPCLGSGVMVVAYGLFKTGLWFPVVTPLISILLSSILLLIQQNQRLQGLASLDELTQVANRRSFDQFLQQAIHQQGTLALVMCDVDYFKRYNDTYGHQAGDECLRTIAQALKQGVRRGDLVARYGGEEFAIVLPNTQIEIACEIIQQIQRQIVRLRILHAGSEIGPYLTLSFGIATIENISSATPQLLIEQADSALYIAKRQGRNQYVLAPFK